MNTVELAKQLQKLAEEHKVEISAKINENTLIECFGSWEVNDGEVVTRIFQTQETQTHSLENYEGELREADQQ